MKNKIKNFVLLFSILLIAFCVTACKTAENSNQPEPEVMEKEQEEPIDESKDKHGREYINDYVEIPSEELRDLTIDFWTRLSLGDESFVDYLYLEDNKKEGLRNLAKNENGKKLYQTIVESINIETEGIPPARFLKLDINEEGDSFVNQNLSAIRVSGKNYSNFLDVLKIKREQPMQTDQELLDYVDRFIQYYPANYTTDTAIQFCYVGGKPLIRGDIFLDYLGVYKNVDKDTKNIKDLTKDAYLVGVEAEGDMKGALDLLKSGEYIQLYEFLKNTGYNQDFDFDPTETIKTLYTASDEIRKTFLNDMAQLPKPLVKTYEENGSKKTWICYFYPDVYRLEASGEMREELYHVENPGEISGFLFENIIKNLLANQGVAVQ